METRKLGCRVRGDFIEALNDKLDNNDVLIAMRNVSGNDIPELKSTSLLALDYHKDEDRIDILLFGGDVALGTVKSMQAEFDCDELSAVEICGAGDASCLIRFNEPIHLPRASMAA